MALNRYRLADQASKKNRRALRLQKMIEEPDRLLGTILLGNNFVNNAAVAITTILAWKLYGEAGVAISTACITVIILVVAEIPPKTMAAMYPDRIAFFATDFLNLLQRVLYPIVWLMSSVVKLLRLIPIFKEKETSNSLDTDELRAAVKASEKHIAPDQVDLLLGILELGSQSVESYMVPHSEIRAVNIENEISDIIEQIRSEDYSRLPVYEKSFEQIKGVLEIRELLQKYKPEEITKEAILELLKKPIYLPEDARLLEQIQRLQEAKQDMGIVVDEYGDVMGLFTLHELMSELAGVISGEVPAGTTPGILAEDGGSYLIHGEIWVRELNRILNWSLPTDGPNTLNGLILEHAEDIPTPGVSFKLDSYIIEIVRSDDTAVAVARIHRSVPKSDTSTQLSEQPSSQLE